MNRGELPPFDGAAEAAGLLVEVAMESGGRGNEAQADLALTVGDEVA